MKIKSTVTEVSHDDLVNLFSTAFYGSDIFAVEWDNKAYSHLKKDGDCIEDILARIILNGGTIDVIDREAEEEDNYSSFIKSYYEEGFGMHYPIDLGIIRDGISNALNGDAKNVTASYAMECAKDLITEDGSFDFIEATVLLQIILFKEVIYG